DGTFGADPILWFNGGLFADANVIELLPGEIRYVAEAAGYDWSNIEPSIFGTLFERILDPSKRGQLGTHYTSREDIETLLKPVLLDPRRREWDAVRAEADKLWEEAISVDRGRPARSSASGRDGMREDADKLLENASSVDRGRLARSSASGRDARGPQKSRA